MAEIHKKNNIDWDAAKRQGIKENNLDLANKDNFQKQLQDKVQDSIGSFLHKPASDDMGKSNMTSELYQQLTAEKKPDASYHNSGNGMEDAIKSIDKAMDFATKLMLASGKNMMLGSEDGGGQVQQMSQMAQSLASMMATKASVQAQIEAIEQQKNPAVDLMSLKDKIVDYDDSTRSFVGEPIKYGYRVSHSEPESAVTVNVVLKICNKNGVPVRTVHQPGKIGEFSYEWDGKDDNGKLVEEGEYSLQVSASGSKSEDGIADKFPVNITTALSGKVDSVKIEQGSATGLMINNRLVQRNEIVGIYDAKPGSDEVDLKSDLIGLRANIDLSKARVKADGSMSVYFNNDVEDSGKMTVQVLDEDGKIITSFQDDKDAKFGQGVLSFVDARLNEGVYDVKVFVENKEDPENIKDVELKYKDMITISGFNRREHTITSVEKNTYDPIHIESVFHDFPTSTEQWMQQIRNSEIKYRNDLFKYSEYQEADSFEFKLPEEDAVISYGKLAIYDAETEELVRIINAEYDLHSILEDDSKNAIQTYLNNHFAIMDYYALNEGDKIEVNRYIKNEVAKGDLVISEENRESYEQGKVRLTFPKWEGLDMENKPVDPERVLKKEFTPVYIRDADGSLFSGETESLALLGYAENVREVDGEIMVKIIDGNEISDKLIIDLIPIKK